MSSRSNPSETGAASGAPANSAGFEFDSLIKIKSRRPCFVSEDFVPSYCQWKDLACLIIF